MLWYIDPSHSQVNFSVKHMMVSTVRGRLGRLAGVWSSTRPARSRPTS